MTKKSVFMFAQYFLGTFISVFGVVWLLLEPLGGLDYVAGIKNQKLVLYVILTIVSLLISTIIYNSKASHERLAEAEKTKNAIVRAGEDRSTFDYLQFLRGAKHSVELLGLSLAPFSTEPYINTLYDLIEQNVRVCILLSNPLSPNLAQRNRCLYTLSDDLRNAAAGTLKTLIRLRRSIGARKKDLLCVRVMNILPHYGLFKVDDMMIWNPYLANRTGLASPYFLFQAGSTWAEHVTQDFATLATDYSFPIDEKTSIEKLRDYLREDQLIYDNYADDESVNQLRPFFV